jgi:hypothetical protein
MSTIVTLATACCVGCVVAQALDIRARLRLACLAAQWSALFWVGLRFASMAVSVVA